MDVSGYTSLKDLGINDTLITSIDLSKNTALENLWLERTKIESIDLSNNTKLVRLWASGSLLWKLDLSKNTALEYLEILKCKNLSSVDLSNNVRMETLDSGSGTSTIVKTVAFVAQPQDVSAAVGETAEFVVEVKGAFLQDARYQWQKLDPDTKKFENIYTEGYKTTNLSVTVSEELNGARYRCVVTDRFNREYISDEATLTCGH